jgi:acyl-CoA reductase-like NAD-dependent aldehyde dehydrogenase
VKATGVDGRMLLNGERVWARSGATFDAIDPATAEVFAKVALGDRADVDTAVASAQAAMAGWAGLPPVRRVRLLNRLAGLLREHSRDFAELESLDVGKPLRQAEDDVAAAAGYFEYFAGVADKVFGSSIPLGKGFVDVTLREPLGVSAQIVPWNYPLRLASRGIAPALACGNAVVAKPAAEAGLSVVRLAELAVEAGFPAGIFNVVTGGRETGAALASHPGINHITFTGSVPTGIAIMKAAADNVVPVTLELGGKSPNIVFADADLERAAASAATTLMQNSAQTCTAPTRLLLEESAHDRFVELLVKRIGTIRMGRGLDNPDMGPVVSERQMQRVLGYIASGAKDGATAVTGGCIWRSLTTSPAATSSSRRSSTEWREGRFSSRKRFSARC